MRLKGWVLGAHAWLAGFGFLVPGLPLTLVLANHLDGRLLSLDVHPTAVSLAAGALAVAAFYALPLLWPLHLAVGLYEMGLVSPVARGDRAACRAARRVLTLQAVPFLLIAVAIAVVTELRWLLPSMVPLAWAGGHGLLARWMTRLPRGDERGAEVPSTSCSAPERALSDENSRPTQPRAERRADRGHAGQA